MSQPNHAPRTLMLGWEDPNKIHGGLGVASAALAEALSKQTDVSFWFPSGQPARTDSAARYRQRVIPVELPAYASGEDLYGEGLAQSLALYNRLVIAEGAAWDPEIVHAHDWMTFEAAASVSEMLDVPLVFHVHSLATDREEKPESLAFQMESKWLKVADLLIAVSEYTKSELVAKYGIDPAKISVLEHGLPGVEAYRSPKPFSEKLVLFLGRMTWQKGPFHFLEMAKEVLRERNDVRFVMAGEGDQWPAVIQEIAQQGLGLNIQAPGHLTRTDIFDLLSMADALVMTSESEPMGLVALEALHFDVPVILPPHCGAREYLPYAPVVPPNDANLLASTLNKLLKKRKSGEKQVSNNKAHISDQSWDLVATRLMELYTPLL